MYGDARHSQAGGEHDHLGGAWRQALPQLALLAEMLAFAITAVNVGSISRDFIPEEITYQLDTSGQAWYTELKLKRVLAGTISGMRIEI